MTRNLLISDSETREYNKIRIKRFLKNIIVAFHKIKTRDKAHKDLHSQINKVKRISTTGAERDRKTEIEKEMSELKERINKLLEMKSAPKLQQLKKEQNNDVKQRIEELESKLSQLINKKSDREKRFEEIEKKVKDKFEDHDETKELIKELREQITRLTSNYGMLEKSKKHSRKKLDSVKERIDRTKHALRQIEAKKISEQFSK